MTTNEAAPRRRMPAEWEPHEWVMIAWPHPDTDWHYMLPQAQDCFSNVISAIARNEKVLLVGPGPFPPALRDRLSRDGLLGNVAYRCVPTDDTWARDFGPIAVDTPEGPIAVDFTFNGWGGKFPADADNLISRRASVWKAPLVSLPFVLEGGSIETDGRGTLLTTSRCLLAPTRNPSMSRTEIEAFLATWLGVDRFLWLDHGALAGDDTDSHIDTLARLAPADTIIYCGPGEPADPNNAELLLMREELRSLRTRDGLPYNLVELPLPSPVYDEDGMQLPATYANYLVAPRHIYLPVYGQPAKDLLASQTLRIAYPDHEIVTVDCRALIRQHGSLHCITMQLPAGLVDDNIILQQ